jgi:hypothetical protein
MVFVWISEQICILNAVRRKKAEVSGLAFLPFPADFFDIEWRE